MLAGESPLSSLPLYFSKAPLKGRNPLVDGVSNGVSFSFRGHLGSSGLLAVADRVLVVSDVQCLDHGGVEIFASGHREAFPGGGIGVTQVAAQRVGALNEASALLL